MKILANDGISKKGQERLSEAGHTVITENVAQEGLVDYLNEEKIDALLVRSATTARKDLIDSCPNLKIIGRGGVGMDNIDVDYARSKGLHVINTPAASSSSVAELAFAHIYSGVRFLHDSNRMMPLEGDSNFKVLKKKYAKGKELKGKTIGIIGFGRIGQELAKRALGAGMNVVMNNLEPKSVAFDFEFFNGTKVPFSFESTPLEELLKVADFISIHVPSQGKALLGEREFAMMKDGVSLVNTARGGVIDEDALLKALDDGKIAYAALDVFVNEPKPALKVLMHPNISLTPHIGGSTVEAQDRIGLELADQIIDIDKTI
jgi:D-3-phosphoglycerate dehydrogenase